MLKQKVVYLLMGTSGSGKTHFANQFRLNHCVISTDDIKKELYGGEWLWYANHGTFTELLKRFRKALYSNAAYTNKIYLDYPFINITSRKQIYKIIEQALHSNNIRTSIIIIFFDTPLSVCLERNKRRAIPVTEKVITRQYKKLKYPEERKNAQYPFFKGTVDIYHEHYPDMPEWFCHRIHRHFDNCCQVIEECIKGGDENALLDNWSNPSESPDSSNPSGPLDHLDLDDILLAAMGVYQEKAKAYTEFLDEVRRSTEIWPIGRLAGFLIRKAWRLKS